MKEMLILLLFCSTAVYGHQKDCPSEILVMSPGTFGQGGYTAFADNLLVPASGQGKFRTIDPSEDPGTKKSMEEVAAVVKEFTKAVEDADTLKLFELTWSGLSYGHSHGTVQTQGQFIHSLATGESDFVKISLADQTIALSGNTAIVRHTLSATTNDRGKPGNVKLYVLLVWQKVKGHWQLLARQAVPAT